jgi:N-acetyl sugar amidotransferase
MDKDKKYIRYCNRCLLPDTKPDLFIDNEGICNACCNYESRKEIDWHKRREELIEILEKYRSKDGSNYDCIIPVSGGKDSTFQVLKILELGYTPLCVTATTCMLSDIGRRNIENLKQLGVDYIEATTNPRIRRKINRLALRQVGDISWPEHVTIFTIPVQIAVKFKIPLIIWGENSQNEYGGPASAVESKCLDRRWLEEFGGLLGMRVTDLVGQEGIRQHDLISYLYPSDAELKEIGVIGIFLGVYLPWDGFHNALLAQSYGFEVYPHPTWGSVVNYANLDNYQVAIHEYFKFLKFGFGRATDCTSLHIRRGRLARDEAIKMVQMHEGKFPWEYLGYPLEKILEGIEMTLEEFISICDRYTNKKLFLCDAKGNLIKDKDGNLTKCNYDNVE